MEQTGPWYIVCLFVHRVVLESAIPPSLEHLTLLARQSGRRGMI